MKKLELEGLGVQEMNTTEMTNVEGGGFGDILININLDPVFKLVADLLTGLVNLLQGLQEKLLDGRYPEFQDNGYFNI